MGDIICCKKEEQDTNLEGKETIDVDNEVYHDESEYPHDSDPSYRKGRLIEDKPDLK